MSSKSVFVYSTLSCPQLYQNWKEGAADLPVPVGEPVRIEGGANVASKHLVTSRGVVTKVTEEQYAYLLENRHFCDHVKNGFVEVSEARADADKVAANLAAKDKSAPVTPDDYPATAPGPKPAAKSAK